jgi:TonB family protein
MSRRLLILAALIGTSILAAAESKGFCPSAPSNLKAATNTPAPQVSPSPDAQYAGSVRLLVVVSDAGYVCDARVIRGLDKESDRKAAESVRKWHFQPARKDGHVVPVVVAVDVNYWRKDGELIQFPTTPPAIPTPGESGRH